MQASSNRGSDLNSEATRAAVGCRACSQPPHRYAARSTDDATKRPNQLCVMLRVRCLYVPKAPADQLSNIAARIRSGSTSATFHTPPIRVLIPERARQQPRPQMPHDQPARRPVEHARPAQQRVRITPRPPAPQAAAVNDCTQSHRRRNEPQQRARAKAPHARAQQQRTSEMLDRPCRERPTTPAPKHQRNEHPRQHLTLARREDVARETPPRAVQTPALVYASHPCLHKIAASGYAPSNAAKTLSATYPPRAARRAERREETFLSAVSEENARRLDQRSAFVHDLSTDGLAAEAIG
jgi:hypothetical protein